MLRSSAQWQQRTDYLIDVQLNAAEKTLEGTLRLRYYNASPDTLRFIWFHLWPNAYRHDRTAFSQQLLRNGDTRFYFSKARERGYLHGLAFRVNGILARTEEHPEHNDIVKLVLPEALEPRTALSISTPFEVQLPYNFSRSGWDSSGHFLATQWYPKPAVYDSSGWHPMPYLDQGEFYSEFGNYEVRITVPANFVVAATGSLVKADSAAPQTPAAGRKGMKTPAFPIARENRTLFFRQDSIHDFAWFAGPHYRLLQDTCVLPGARVVTIRIFHWKNEKEWANVSGYAKKALRFYSETVGVYPYSTLSIVQGPESSGGGMEYPTITVIDPALKGRELDLTVAHEIGHNWFYGILASNEREHPWLDEGLNTYLERQYERRNYAPRPGLEEMLQRSLSVRRRDQPIHTSSIAFSREGYSLIAYHKTARWLEYIEQQSSPDSLRLLLRQWFERYRFRHVQPEDFFALLREHFGNRAEAWIEATRQKGLLPNQEAGKHLLLTPFSPRRLERYLYNPNGRAWLLTPAFGANIYDGLMAGAVFTNHLLPPKRFQVLALPLYATRSRQLNGLARLSWTQRHRDRPRQWQASVSALTFSHRNARTEKGTPVAARFFRFIPGIEWEFRHPDPRIPLRHAIQWKSFFIGEEAFRYRTQTVIDGADTSFSVRVSKEPVRYSIHQLRLSVENERALYPYQFSVQAQFSGLFTRLQAEGTYFFNYAAGGGLSVRLFAGKFFYDRNRIRYPNGLYPQRFFLNMSAAGGEEDYTYSHYFAGRNAFEGLAAQQVALRDGGFKIRSALLANPIGQSDDWLAAINFNSSLPDGINPLSLFPVKIPLHVFADIGTYSGAWNEATGTDRFLFDAGLHIPLAAGAVNLYFPLFYSRAFTDYTRSVYPKNRFWRTMTFSIHLETATKIFKRSLAL